MRLRLLPSAFREVEGEKVPGVSLPGVPDARLKPGLVFTVDDDAGYNVAAWLRAGWVAEVAKRPKPPKED